MRVPTRSTVHVPPLSLPGICLHLGGRLRSCMSLPLPPRGFGVLTFSVIHQEFCRSSTAGYFAHISSFRVCPNVVSRVVRIHADGPHAPWLIFSCCTSTYMTTPLWISSSLFAAAERTYRAATARQGPRRDCRIQERWWGGGGGVKRSERRSNASKKNRGRKKRPKKRAKNKNKWSKKRGKGMVRECSYCMG